MDNRLFFTIAFAPYGVLGCILIISSLVKQKAAGFTASAAKVKATAKHDKRLEREIKKHKRLILKEIRKACKNGDFQVSYGTEHIYYCSTISVWDEETCCEVVKYLKSLGYEVQRTENTRIVVKWK